MLVGVTGSWILKLSRVRLESWAPLLERCELSREGEDKGREGWRRPRDRIGDDSGTSGSSSSVSYSDDSDSSSGGLTVIAGLVLENIF